MSTADRYRPSVDGAGFNKFLFWIAEQGTSVSVSQRGVNGPRYDRWLFDGPSLRHDIDALVDALAKAEAEAEKWQAIAEKLLALVDDHLEQRAVLRAGEVPQ